MYPVAARFYHTFKTCISDRSIRSSILGRIVMGAGAELIGGAIGAYCGGSIVGRGLAELGYHVAPLAGATALYGLLKHPKITKTAILGFVATAGVTVPVAYAALSALGSPACICAGTWIGRNVGTILGGYAGLKFTQTSIPFWDRTAWADSYAVGMTKHIVAGEIFNATVASSTLPVLCYPLNIIRGICETVVRMLAYNSNPVISAVKTTFRERQLSQEALLPLAVKVLCQKYCEKNAAPITTKLLQIFSRTFNAIPEAANKMESLLRLYAYVPCEAAINNLGNQSEKVSILLMRSFVGYANCIAKYPEPEGDFDRFKRAFKAEFKGATEISQLISPLLQGQIENLAQSILQAIQDSERDLTGHVLTENTDVLKPLLALHIKYFLIYTLLNRDIKPLTVDEEREFFVKLEKAFFSLYDKQPLRSVEKLTHAALTFFFQFKKWVYPMLAKPEQAASAHESFTTKEEYFPKPPAEEGWEEAKF